MNTPRILYCGSKLLTKHFPVLTLARTEKLTSPQTNLFSSLCKSNSFPDSSKFTLPSYSPLCVNSRGMKVRGHLQLRCKDCYFERKDGVLYVMCSSYPRHKQRQLTKRDKYTWMLTYCFMSKQRPW